MEETYKGKFSYTQIRMICRATRDKKSKKNPLVESRGSERTLLLSKLFLREDLRCRWIQSWSTVYV